MTTLTDAPVGPLLARLFAENDARRARPGTAFADVAPEERKRLARSRTEYLDFYGRLGDAALPVSRETGVLLYMLARASHAHTIVEFGTSFAISTLHLAAGLRDNGGGRLIATEFEPSKLTRARAHLAEGGLLDLVELREGDALVTLARDLPPMIDLVLLDGAKPLYNDVLDLLEPALRPGALIVADNASDAPDYMARVRAPGRGYVSAPCGPDVELSMRSRGVRSRGAC